MARATTRWQVECACPEIFSRRSLPRSPYPCSRSSLLSSRVLSPSASRALFFLFAVRRASSFHALLPRRSVRRPLIRPFTLRPADNARRRPPSTVLRDSALILEHSDAALRCLGCWRPFWAARLFGFSALIRRRREAARRWSVRPLLTLVADGDEVVVLSQKRGPDVAKRSG